MGALDLHPNRLQQERCCVCDVAFGMTARLMQRRRDDGKSFYCVNGHSQSYGKTKADRLQEKLDAEKARREFAERRRDNEIASHRATKGHLTRAKGALEKAKNGVCPCCRRNFANLRRHMQSQHPEWDPKAEASP